MKPGDRVKIKTKKEIFEGILMPRSELADDGHIVVKLDSGYNIGISKKDIEKSDVIKGSVGKPKLPDVKFDKSKPPISLISTGGTIISKVDYKTGGVFPLEKPEEFLSLNPSLADFVNVKNLSQPFSLLSEDMTSEEWGKIAKEVAKELNSDARGVIVTHGTDTLHFTAAALSFMLPNLSKPVAVVGSQRSPDRGSSDATQNMLCATHYCLGDIAEVAIVMHGTTSDDYCIASRGTKVRKMHSSRRDAFRPIDELPLAKIFPEGNIIMGGAGHNQRTDGETKLDAKFEEKVALLYSYPGADPGVLDHCVEKGFRGVVLAGTGFGHVATQTLNKKFNWLPSIKKAIGAGMFVSATTQTIYGHADPYVYSAGRLMLDDGVVFLKDMLPEVAYVKLGWVLGHKDWDPKEKMLENVAGEINERIEPEAFLY